MNRIPLDLLFAYEEGQNLFLEAMKELFEYIKTEYFTINYGEYSNLGLDPLNQGGVSVKSLFCLFSSL